MDAVIRKLMIVPWIGALPDWIGEWCANTAAIEQSGHGWDFLLDVDERRIRERIEALGVTCPALEGRKLCDYRPAFGEMYAGEIEGYDFWGHTDLDCVYGKLWDFVSDDLLENCDVFSNDPYPQMCGPFTCYRNTESVNGLFRKYNGWREIFESPELHAFDETGISAVIARSRLRVRHEHFEGADSMYIHFTSDKSYPRELAEALLS